MTTPRATGAPPRLATCDGGRADLLPLLPSSKRAANRLVACHAQRRRSLEGRCRVARSSAWPPARWPCFPSARRSVGCNVDAVVSADAYETPARDEYEQQPTRDAGQDACCSFGERTSSPAGSSRLLGTTSKRLAGSTHRAVASPRGSEREPLTVRHASHWSVAGASRVAGSLLLLAESGHGSPSRGRDCLEAPGRQEASRPWAARGRPGLAARRPRSRSGSHDERGRSCAGR
jgi:hypothetical protein